ncbi:penicillin-binding protein [Rhodospirillales bacterium 47_12_T64]|nr:penicillin-binding protein [Rhodospirillales bacterium 47_12_T64]
MATDKKTPKKTSKKKTTSRGSKTLKADSKRRITSAGRGGSKAKKAMPKKRKTTTPRKAVRAKAAGSRGGRKRGFVKTLFLWMSVLSIWGIILLGGVIGWYAWDLPDVGNLDQIARRPSVTLMSEDGIRLASYGDVYGDVLEVDEMSPYLPQAIIAIEDRRFYDHFGIDLLGIARAMLVNIRAGRMAHGGSTITQQLAKNLFLSSERSLKRKIQEALLAIWLEQKFTKKQILTIYMNRVYFGAGTYGVDAAARIYFGLSARKIGLYESALIAGLLKAPSRYNPNSSASKAETRTNIVLDSMVAARFISEESAAKAKKNKPSLKRNTNGQGRFFTDWVLRQIDEYIGGYRGDIIVHTTLNTRHQRLAEKHLLKVLKDNTKKRKVDQGAVVVMSNYGAVTAMVGGKDYRASQFNRATQALRQPGSAFKPFVFLAGVESGLRPDSRFTDKSIRVGKWKPRNYNGKYYGDVTLRDAFARSMNSVAVQVSEKVGRKQVAEVAHRLGIQSDLDISPSIALGTSEVTLLELTGSYAVFANGGQAVAPFGINQIQDRKGNKLYQRKGSGLGRVVKKRNVAMINDMMSATVAWGTGKAAQTGRAAAGKTGTTQDSRDALFVGYTPYTVAGVWFGNDNNSPMKGVTGGSLPAKVWGNLVRELEQGKPVVELPQQSPTVVEDVVEEASGFLESLFGRLSSGKNTSPNDNKTEQSKNDLDYLPSNKGNSQFK